MMMKGGVSLSCHPLGEQGLCSILPICALSFFAMKECSDPHLTAQSFRSSIKHPHSRSLGWEGLELDLNPHGPTPSPHSQPSASPSPRDNTGLPGQSQPAAGGTRAHQAQLTCPKPSFSVRAEIATQGAGDCLGERNSATCH